MVFAMHKCELAIGIHVSPPFWNLLPPPSPPYLSRLAPFSWISIKLSGLDTDADLAFTHQDISLSLAPPSFFHTSAILLFISSAQPTSHVPWFCHHALESCQWLNESCYKNKWHLPSFTLLPLSIIFTFVSIVIAWHFSVLAISSLLLWLSLGILGLKYRYCTPYSTVQ